MDAQGGKYLTFLLSEEEYGIPIQKVKEIIGIMDITAIPKTPEFIKGVINLRGKIIPIIDLRLKFELSEREYTHRTCIIVVEVNIGEANRLIGLVVDTVSEVINIKSEEIENPPQYNLSYKDGLLTGMGKVKGKVILLLEIGQIIKIEEMVI